MLLLLTLALSWRPPPVQNQIRNIIKKSGSIKDFVILKPISKGAFGKVFLAKKKTTDDVYAIKVINKNEMEERQQVNILSY